MHLSNVVSSNEREERCEQYSSDKRSGAPKSQPPRCWVVAAEKKLRGIRKRVANIRTERRQCEPRQDVCVMCLVRVSNPIEVIRESVAEPSREQEREIVDDAPTFPVADCCLFERMVIAHDVCRLTQNAAMPGRWRADAIVVANRHWLAWLVGTGPARDLRTRREPHASSPRSWNCQRCRHGCPTPDRLNASTLAETSRPASHEIDRTEGAPGFVPTTRLTDAAPTTRGMEQERSRRVRWSRFVRRYFRSRLSCQHNKWGHRSGLLQ